MSARGDRELDAIRHTIGAFEQVAGLDDVMAVLQRLVEQGQRAELLDAIGHSRSRGWLMLGDWVIDDTPQTAATFSMLLRPLLEELGVHTIRLLGCSTAATPACQVALQGIAQAARCAVLGTTRPIGRADYAAGGFVAEHDLWATRQLRRG